MRDMSINQWGDILSGRITGDSYARPYRATKEDVDHWAAIAGMSPTLQETLASTESYTDFFKAESDIALLIDKRAQSEFFYSLKNGMVVPNCPAEFIYFARAIFNKFHICNLIGCLLPREVSMRARKKEYFGAGYTALDVLRNFVCKDFRPLTASTPIVSCGEWFEVLVPSTGMVVALPTAVGMNLRPEDLPYVQMSEQGMVLHGQCLASLGGCKTGPCSYYDLR